MLIFNRGGGGILYTTISISPKYLLEVSTFSLGASDFLGNGPMVLDDMISVLDLIHHVNYIISSIF